MEDLNDWIRREKAALERTFKMVSIQTMVLRKGAFVAASCLPRNRFFGLPAYFLKLKFLQED